MIDLMRARTHGCYNVTKREVRNIEKRRRYEKCSLQNFCFTWNYNFIENNTRKKTR